MRDTQFNITNSYQLKDDQNRVVLISRFELIIGLLVTTESFIIITQFAWVRSSAMLTMLHRSAYIKWHEQLRGAVVRLHRLSVYPLKVSSRLKSIACISYHMQQLLPSARPMTGGQ